MKPRPALARMVSRHARDAAFLWLLRSKAARQPHHDLGDLAKLDGRVEAHLDGLRIAGDEAWKPVEKNLEMLGDAGEVFAVAVLALEQGDAVHLKTAVNAVEDQPDRVAGLVSALGWVGWERARIPVSGLLRSGDPLLAGAGLRACAVNRQHPGPALEAALRSKEPALAAQAARAAGELGRVELLPLLGWHLGTDSKEMRFWAAWAGALLGSKGATEVLAAIAKGGGACADRAAATCARAMESKARGVWLAQLLRDPGRTRKGAIVAGVMGDPASIPWLIEAMREPQTARVAGEAFSLITGVDLALQDLEGDEPAGFEAGPNDDPADEDVSADPDENLPWPDAALVSGWWRKQGPKFAPGKRYLLGRPVTRESLRAALCQGKQRQRIAAAEELKLLDPGQVLFECRAPGQCQLRELAV
jgi:uncharacterized protein (TIGR02270 family)